MKFQKVRKQANFWHIRSTACSQFVHIYFCLFLGEICIFLRNNSKKPACAGGKRLGQLGLREPRLAFSVLSVCSVVRIPLAGK